MDILIILANFTYYIKTEKSFKINMNKKDRTCINNNEWYKLM